MKQVKLKKTKPLPFAPTNAPDPWGRTFGVVQKQLAMSHEFASPSDRLVRQVIDVTLISALHWVYKKQWKSKYRVPLAAKDFETWGDLFNAYLSLCTHVHLLHPLGLEYVNAGAWFLEICREFRSDGFAQARRQHSKKDDVAAIRRSVKALQKTENPVDRVAMPHTWAIFQASLESCNASDTIERLFSGSQGLVPILKKLCTEIDHGAAAAAVWSEGDRVMVQSKTGRQLLECKNPLVESFLSGVKTFN